ncbi:macrophage mannose receptor 1-like isoform X2 [Fundulus heteroclitus]|uniref:macrophage mannose receptor 1-like isoform X2 n=1 Tax=Fundulus heteroclitus TaxID=8078 RepID=UPI00165B49D6|nr:macrophage mannose receptor 1-like isoform X2 [Fundulus heteroclitus]
MLSNKRFKHCCSSPETSFTSHRLETGSVSRFCYKGTGLKGRKVRLKLKENRKRGTGWRESSSCASVLLQVAWIGLYDNMNSWMWSMSDSDFYQHDENFTNWETEEPNNYAGIESCVEMYDNGRWNDKPCAEQKNSICFDVTGTNVTFVHISIKMNWTDSQRYCREVHTDLASVRNIAENQKVNELMSPGEKVWIGLFRNTWTWSDGTSSAFRYWSSGEPNGNSDNCAAADMKNHGKWEDWNCEVKTTFICSADPVHTKQVKLKVVGSSSVDLNNPEVLEDLLKEMKQKLKDQGVDEDIRLSWKKQKDGKIFHKDEEKSRNNNNNEL